MVNTTITTPIVVAPSQSSSFVKEPGKYDILCGKDKTCLSHYGSKHFRGVIEVHRNRYEKASTKHEKMSITQEIVVTLNRTSSRFLKFNAKLQGWEEISHMAARDKVSHALRFANNRSRKAKDKINKKTKPKNKSTAKKEIVKKVSPPSSKSEATLSKAAVATISETTPFVPDTTTATTTTTTTTTTRKKKGHVRKVSEEDDLFSDITSQLFENSPQTLEPTKSQNSSSGKRRRCHHVHHVRKVSDDDDVFTDVTLQLLFDQQPHQTLDLSSGAPASNSEKKKGHVRKVSNDDNDDTLRFDFDPSELNDYVYQAGHSSSIVEDDVDVVPVAAITPCEDMEDGGSTASSAVIATAAREDPRRTPFHQENSDDQIYPHSTSVIIGDDSDSDSDSDCHFNITHGSEPVVVEQEERPNSSKSTNPVNCSTNYIPSLSTVETTSSRFDFQEDTKENRSEIDCKKDISHTSNDLSWIIKEPLMEWDLSTDTISIL